MVLPHSHKIPRVSWYSGFRLGYLTSRTGLSPSPAVAFQPLLCSPSISIIRSEPRMYYYIRFRLFRVRSPLLAESHFVFSSWGYLDVSVPPVSPRYAMDLRSDDSTLLLPGFPIRKSADHWLFAPTRSLSQLVTSFFVSQCQGILPALLVA